MQLNKENDMSKYERPVIKSEEDVQRILKIGMSIIPIMVVITICLFFGVGYLVIKSIELISGVSLLPN